MNCQPDIDQEMPDAPLPSPDFYNEQPKDKSNSKWLRDNGYSSMEEFMSKYGLKYTSSKDIKEAENLICCFRGMQQADWEKGQLIHALQVWHSRLGHLNYHALMRLSTVSNGMPELGLLKIGDIPVCEACLQAGFDPLEDKEDI